jgi:tetratricopeptide (TPR) repeat protein
MEIVALPRLDAMIVSGIRMDEAASRAAGEGQAALTAGDTGRARACFLEAGKRVEDRIELFRKQPEKHLARLLAASQYYQGGDYQKALKLARKVDSGFLTPELRVTFQNFFRDVNERASPDYPDRIRKQLLAAWEKKDSGAILALVKDHPYILHPAKLAFAHAVGSERSGDYHTAAALHADAIRRWPDSPELVFVRACYPLELAGNGKPEEAWKYVEHQLKETPHAITFATASIIRGRQAIQSQSDQERGQLVDEQNRYHEEAWRTFSNLPARFRDNRDLRDLMTLCLDMVAFALHQTDDDTRAREICTTAIAFSPQSHELRTTRGIITYPGGTAEDDFREAIRLRETRCYPWYFLAHASLAKGDHSAAASWCRQALEHRPSRTLEAQLCFWLAMAQKHLGARPDEILFLQYRAQELEPENDAFHQDSAKLESLAVEPLTLRSTSAWRDYLDQRELRLIERRSRIDATLWDFVPTGS